MISKENLVCVGHISRPHSFKGEIQFSLNKKIALLQGDFVFIKLEGQYIPYQILNVKGKKENPIVNLEFVDTYEDAQELCSNEIYADIDEQPEESELSFIGFEVIDKNLGTIGVVKDVQNLPQQLMLIVPYNDKDAYIPLVEAFINYISPEKKEIWLTLPQGLLDL
ncbi:MAG: hypothetical protein KJP21_05345 [Bacteroidia bacterium]|nr:hypothetical protein [Bacteroidia bacterium]NNJ56358.1 hypothetical protein [Bacteroidia bacterium]